MRRLLRSPRKPDVLAAPGNAGIARDKVECVPVEVDDIDGLVDLARARGADLVVVGPEVPLVLGLVDALAEAGIAAFGPSKEAAQLEGSKRYAKELMEAVGVPTAGYEVLTSKQQALEAIGRYSYPLVLKADSLAAGKGVIICPDQGAAQEAIDAFFTEHRFGDTEVVLEEFLHGEELSLLAVCDGERAVAMAPAQDYKRIFDGDEGPNTGGMGSYSPVPGIDRDHADALARAVHQPIVDEMKRRGTPFHGILYAGLMMTAEGPKVLEYNCRFGDPETQAVLTRLRSDIMELLERLDAYRGTGRPGHRVVGRVGRDGGAGLARLPRDFLERRRDPRPAVDRLDRGRGAARRDCRGERPDRDRGRAGAERDRYRRNPGRGARARVRRGAAGAVRRQADAYRHRGPGRR